MADPLFPDTPEDEESVGAFCSVNTQRKQAKCPRHLPDEPAGPTCPQGILNARFHKHAGSTAANDSENGSIQAIRRNPRQQDISAPDEGVP